MPTPHDNKRVPYLPALTSIRFFAVSMIVFLHSTGHFNISTRILAHVSLVQGVSFFFVLSGFVMTHVYAAFESRAQIYTFWVARLARIWPLHMATLLLSVLLITGKIYDPSIFFANMGLVHAWIPLQNYFFSYNALSWAVSTEFALYLCFPFLIQNWEKTWHVKTAVVLFSLITVMAICHHIGLPQNPETGVGFAGILYISPFGRLYEFCLGMATALAYKKIKHRYRPIEKLGSFVEITAFSMAVFMIFQSRKLAAYLLPWVGDIGKYWIELGGVSSVFFAGVILVTALNKGLISKLLSNKRLVFLGEISFATYLLHQIMINFYANRFADSAKLPTFLVYCIFLGILLTSSSLAWAFVEKPSRRWILDGYKLLRKEL